MPSETLDGIPLCQVNSYLRDSGVWIQAGSGQQALYANAQLSMSWSMPGSRGLPAGEATITTLVIWYSEFRTIVVVVPCGST